LLKKRVSPKIKVSTTTTILRLSSLILCIRVLSTDSFSTLKSLNKIASYYSQTDDTALLQSTSNATHTFNYILVMSDSSTEINDFVVIALDNIESEIATAPPLERRDPRCFNNVNKAKGAGCPNQYVCFVCLFDSIRLFTVTV
jgi:hypothetical protein